MKIKKIWCIVLVLVTLFLLIACGDAEIRPTKTMEIKAAADIRAVAPGADLQLAVFEGSQKLVGALFEIRSGPAKIHTLSGLLTCDADAKIEEKIEVGAILSGYTCKNLILTVVADAVDAIEPVSVSLLAPTAESLTVGTHRLAAAVLPAEASQAVRYAFVGVVPTGVTLLEDELTVTSAAADNAAFTIAVTSAVNDKISATRTFAVDNLPATPEVSPWNKAPSVKSVFYDDFASGIDGNIWRIENDAWGANNNGVRPANISYTTDKNVAKEFGAESGGVAVLQSNGDFMQAADRRREGANLVTRQAFGPGKYEVRMKVLPRLGQCTALWTYWSGNSGSGIPYENYTQIRYSEIDIELPLWGDFRNISGVSYQYFSSSWDWATQVNNRRDVLNVEDRSVPALNDGRWHTFAFDWRTDAANGDRGVIWYADGKEFGRKSTWIPEYTATFNIANWFPEEVPWIGDPTFETAYMYVDWVRITQYDDPAKIGSTGVGSGGTATNLGARPIPLTDYIANGTFGQALTVKNTRNQDITSWTQAAGAVKRAAEPNRLMLEGGSKATQAIGAQYAGYTFSLDVDAEVTGGTGKCRAYVEYCNGDTAIQNPALTVVGRSEALEFTGGERAAQKLVFTVVGAGVNHIRLVIETEAGTTASVYRTSMFLL
ncbi:MAG: glycoside hydrolase family 16 protein [Clostridiales bacterium]|jgi:hypothetical protein|nr:glycoside hydrolase family 16 protein [Clostridiales bacterium]